MNHTSHLYPMVVQPPEIHHYRHILSRCNSRAETWDLGPVACGSPHPIKAQTPETELQASSLKPRLGGREFLIPRWPKLP
jgi:hypothetical protein